MNGEIKRHTAYKIAIGLIAKGNPELEPDKDDPTKQRFRFLTLKDKEINRVNLIANVIDKFESEEKNYATLTLDDGTGQIRIKAFSDNTKLIKNNQPGDTILVIGTLGYFGNELYILPEIVKPIDARWLLVRKLELEKEYGELYMGLGQLPKPPLPQPSETKPKKEQESIIESQEIKEEKIETTEKETKELLREQIIEIIKEAENEEGIDIEKIIMKLQDYQVGEINNTITGLLEEGTIYEPRPGHLRIL